jgi:predicted RNase H-like HicB family nuclease
MKTDKRKRAVRDSDPAVQSYLTQPYSRILIPQEGGGFSAEILEFPGCFAEGETADQAYANLEAAAASWVAACLSNGTPIPPALTNYEASGKFALRLPRSLYQRAAKAAAKDGVSLNQFVTAAVAERLGSQTTTEKLEAIVAEMRVAIRGLHVLPGPSSPAPTIDICLLTSIQTATTVPN